MNDEFSLDWYFSKNTCLSNEVYYCLAVPKKSLYQLLLAIDIIIISNRYYFIGRLYDRLDDRAIKPPDPAFVSQVSHYHLQSLNTSPSDSLLIAPPIFFLFFDLTILRELGCAKLKATIVFNLI